MSVRVVKFPLFNLLSYEEQASIINNIIDALYWISPSINPDAGKIEPPASIVTDGFLALADGVNWNPAGDGTKGLFRWNGTGWVYIG